MANDTNHNTKKELENVAENSGARTAAINANPEISLEEARNANAGESPNASGGTASSSAEDYVSSTSDPNATNLPSANMPNPPKTEPPSDANDPYSTVYVDRE